jgi:hypothetical protein
MSVVQGPYHRGGVPEAVCVPDDVTRHIIRDSEDRTPPKSSYIRTWAAIQSGRARVQGRLDAEGYPARVVVTDAQLARPVLEHHAFHGDWNYTIHPKRH